MLFRQRRINLRNLRTHGGFLSKNKNNKRKQSIKETSSAKKAALLESANNNNLKPYLIITICALIVVAGAWYYFFSNNDSQSLTRASEKSPQVASQAEEARYSSAIFEDGKARHYQYAAGNGITVKYFILKSSDGVIRAAFDACDVCWPAGKGYFQKGDVMVCRNCGRQFASVRINEVKGGCNPGPLERTIVGDELVIQVKSILEGVKYFDFSDRG